MLLVYIYKCAYFPVTRTDVVRTISAPKNFSYLSRGCEHFFFAPHLTYNLTPPKPPTYPAHLLKMAALRLFFLPLAIILVLSTAVEAVTVSTNCGGTRCHNARLYSKGRKVAECLRGGYASVDPVRGACSITCPNELPLTRSARSTFRQSCQARCQNRRKPKALVHSRFTCLKKFSIPWCLPLGSNSCWLRRAPCKLDGAEGWWRESKRVKGSFWNTLAHTKRGSEC